MPLLFEKLAHLTKTLRSYIYRDPVPLDWRLCDNLAYGTSLPAADDPRWRALKPGEPWGSRLTWAWLVSDATIPDGFVGKPAALHLAFEVLRSDPSAEVFSPPEAMITVLGVDAPPQAINAIHHEVWLAEQATARQPLHIVMDCCTGNSHPGDHRVRLNTAELVWIDRDTEALYWDAAVLIDAIAALPEAVPERGTYLRALDDAFRRINWLNPPDEAFLASVREARAVLQERIFQHSPLAGDVAPRPVLHALGHAHLDVEWLWPLSVTRGKAARTFATALVLMDQYPDYTFTQSQPHLYKIVSEDYPELFGRVKARIAEGRWNATGGTWVEMDTNITGGESLVRQFLYGMRYFERTLGVRPEVLWLPDTFGYSAALPQLMRLAGIRYFFTTKLSWNQYTRHPYETFWWEGIDGSRILTHLATTPSLDDTGRLVTSWMTYNASMTPAEVFQTWTEYQQKDANHHLIFVYGLGDGGGGPNRDMLERRTRLDDLPGLPQVRYGTAEEFFHALADTIPDNLPHWVGELYLQVHRGTFTSQARTKRYNRKTESLLHNAEALASMAHLLKSDYPQAALNAAWETVMLNQFHDILPGSSIDAVYEETGREYVRTQAQVSEVLAGALERIAQHIRYDDGMQGVAVFNTLSITQGGPVEVTLPGDGPVEIVEPSGGSKPFQWLDRGARRALIVPTAVPAYGHKAYAVRPTEREAPPSVENPVTGTTTYLENHLLRAEFDAKGNLIRVYDRQNSREVLAPGEIGNQLWAYVDRPHQFDAWDVETYVQDQGWRLDPDSIRLVEAGPLRAALEITYRFNQSRLVQRVSLLAGQQLLTFDTDVDWHEHHILLRAHFPLAIRAMHATYEIQFGTIQRPTHYNTPWDQAQHEVPAQQWSDLSEGGYGASLINDCKYGHSAQGNVLTLSLLRSPTYPDPEADQGQHAFTYALYPHPGDWRQGTIAQARRLNYPLLVQPVPGGGTWLPVEFGLVTCRTPGVIVDTVKKAEDSDALIVRVYEAHGGRTGAALTFATRIESADEVNLLEEPIGPADVTADTLRFNLTPYQIRSFRIQLGDLLKQQLG
jgi:alpha-mannosidase